LLILWLLMEGPAAFTSSIRQAGWLTWATVLWQSVGNTLFGYTCWAWLLSRYPAATVAPLSLLVPIFGFASSSLILGESLQLWKIGATLLIMAGLAINLLCVAQSRPARGTVRPFCYLGSEGDKSYALVPPPTFTSDAACRRAQEMSPGRWPRSRRP
jgi:uncharacterized membrane protein